MVYKMLYKMLYNYSACLQIHHQKAFGLLGAQPVARLRSAIRPDCPPQHSSQHGRQRTRVQPAQWYGRFPFCSVMASSHAPHRTVGGNSGQPRCTRALSSVAMSSAS